MKRPAERVAIIGIGSPHGDDQFGWVVADALEKGYALDVQTINNPIDLIHSLEGTDRVIVVDAAFGLPEDVTFQRLDFANTGDRAFIRQIPSHGTHDMSVDLVLRIAESLGKRTNHVQVWVGNAKQFERVAPMSHDLTVVAKRCAAEIAKELCGARTNLG